MTRVLMFVPQYPYPVVGGLEKQAHELSKALMAQGVSVQALSGKTSSDQPHEEVVEGVPVTRIPWSSRRAARVVTAPFAIAVAMWKRRKSFDVVHLHQNSWVSLYVLMLARFLGKVTLAKLPNVGEFGIPGMLNGPFGRLRQKVFLSSDAVVAMSTESLAELQDVEFPRGRVLLTPNGIALLPAQPTASAPDLLPESSCRVVFVGRLSPEKQLNVLLDAWALVCADETHAASLEVWGSGDLDNDLKQQAVRQGTASRIHFAGRVENVAAKLADADLFVLPSRFEGNSNAVLEAMAAGLPIVSTPVGGTPMQVGKEGEALLCRSGDAQSLADVLLSSIKDRPLRIKTGAAMRRRVETYFDIESIARIYRAAYVFLSNGQRHKLSELSNPVFSAGQGK